MKEIVIGCDNAAVAFKNQIKSYVEQLGYQTEDVGVFQTEDQTYYPDVAAALCSRIIESGYQKEGILICGTGIGMAMTANKYKGIRAAVCHDIYSTQRSKLSNNGNVMCMGARVIGLEMAKVLVKEWLELKFVDGSSTPKVEAMCHVEECTMK